MYPLQCSCLENPRDGGAWWAAVYGVAQSRTQLKRLSSSSSKGKEARENVKKALQYRCTEGIVGEVISLLGGKYVSHRIIRRVKFIRAV